jgi:hypothetical protein
MADTELEALQQLIAERLQALGRITVSPVCRTVHKILILHRGGGAGVRVLICRDSEIGRPFINIMPIVDGKSLVDDGHSLRGVLTNGAGLEPIIKTIEAAYEAALKAGHLQSLPPPPPSPPAPESPPPPESPPDAAA